MRFILLLLLALTLSNAQLREALLIGNSNYQYISDLENPSKNLRRLKETLEDLDFRVTVKKDLNSENLEEVIDRFASRLARDSQSIGLLYYTGHGCQVDYQGYLIPTNVDTQKKLKIKYNALNINKMLETLEGAGNRINMVFLDACRDVPTGAKGGTKGLGQPMARPKGSLIVYATEAGKVASDNSRFINSLIENISKSNQSIRNIGDNISNDVAQKSGYAQIPEVYTKLLPSITLTKENKTCTQTIPIPAKYRTVTKRVLVSEPLYKYTWLENGVYQTLEPKTKVVTEKVKVSDGTERYVLGSTGKYKKVRTPSKYTTVKITKVIEDVDMSKIPFSVNYKRISIPPTYKTATIQELVEPAKLKTISLPCSEVN